MAIMSHGCGHQIAREVEDGHYTVSLDFIAMYGDWAADVVINYPEFNADFRVHLEVYLGKKKPLNCQKGAQIDRTTIKVKKVMGLKRALWIAFPVIFGWLVLIFPVEAHTGEGFHPEVLWDLLKTALLVVLALAAVIGALWLYRRARSR